MFAVSEAVCGYPGSQGREPRKILDGISFTVERGEVLCILGVNGVGKTTLFRSVLGTLPLLGGTVTLDGRSIAGMSRQEIAGRMAYVPQSHNPPFPFTVLEVTVMGRTAHLSLFARPSTRDREIALNALQTLHIEHLAHRVYTEISGGERQLVLIARALTQEADLLIMDEPTANLDFGNQIRVLQHIDRLAQAGKGILLTSHNPDQAFLCSSQVVVIKGERNFLLGTAEEVVTEELMREVYGIHTQIVTVTDPKGVAVKSVISFL